MAGDKGQMPSKQPFKKPNGPSKKGKCQLESSLFPSSEGNGVGFNKENIMQDKIDVIFISIISVLSGSMIAILVFMGVQTHEEKRLDKKQEMLVHVCLHHAALGNVVIFKQDKKGNVHCNYVIEEENK